MSNRSRKRIQIRQSVASGHESEARSNADGFDPPGQAVEHKFSPSSTSGVHLMHPTIHAIKRFQQRVSAVSFDEAKRCILEAATCATVRGTPRRWTPVAPSPGLKFAYPTQLPGVCFLVRGGAVVTIYERSTCRSWWTPSEPHFTQRHHPAKPYKRPPPGHRFEDAT